MQRNDPSVSAMALTAPLAGEPFGRENFIVSPERGDAPKGQRGKSGRGVTLWGNELLRFKPTAPQGRAPSGGILFLFMKKEYGERHAKGPFVLWNLR